MAFSYEVYPGLTGLVTDFAVPFGFINRSHVTADVDGVSSPFTWLSDGMIRITPGPTGNLTITRNTPKETQVVTFTDGSTQSAELHNLQNLQLLYVTQEAYDSVTTVLGGDGVMWDAQGQPIGNLGDPTDAQDAVTKLWAETSMESQLAQAITARVAAQLAETNAETAESNAVTARIAADAAQVAAEAAKVAAEAARDAAQGHATTASGAASTATTKASEASTSATSASGSATTATTKATEATTKAAEAAASATAAANSASQAAASAASVTIASQAEAEAGTENTKLLTPLRGKQLLLANKTRLAVAPASPTAAASFLLTDIPVGKECKIVLFGLQNNNTANATLRVKFSTDGGATFLTNELVISRAANWNAKTLSGEITLIPALSYLGCMTLEGVLATTGSEADLYYRSLGSYLVGGNPVVSPLVNSALFSWSVNNFAAVGTIRCLET